MGKNTITNNKILENLDIYNAKMDIKVSLSLYTKQMNLSFIITIV